MNKIYVTVGTVLICVLMLGFFALRNADGTRNKAMAQQANHREHEDHEQHAEHTDDTHGREHEDDEEKGHESETGTEEPDNHDEEVVRLSDAELQEFDIRLATAKPGSLDQYIELPGEIVLNADRMAHVVPRVGGIVREVRATVGDRVKKGRLLAILESRELAEAKAAYLAAVEREKLAQANFQREERLWKKKVTSEQEFLDARQSLSEVKIEKNSTEQQLHALGISEDFLKNMPEHPDASYTRFEIRSPQDGTIIEKHITLGENVGTDADVFTIADLSTVWVNLNVYQKDLVRIREGQRAEIEIGHGIPSAAGAIAWIAPRVDEETRTARGRIVLANPDGNFRPGLFVTARVAVGSSAVDIVIPKTALQSFEDQQVVFVRTERGFEPRPVEIGRQNGATVEIIKGLEPGETYAAEGAFTLKAQLSKGAFGDGHNH